MKSLWSEITEAQEQGQKAIRIAEETEDKLIELRIATEYAVCMIELDLL